MMARHNVHINCSKSIDLDDETTLNTLNGKTTFTGRNTPNGRQYLLINGTLTITPDAGDALRQYMGMSINGTVYCPRLPWAPCWPARPTSTASCTPTPKGPSC